jgi:hypothetical protein
MATIILERWYVAASPGQCAGCRYLGGVGVFHRGEGPQPPLHGNCNCRRRQINSRGMSRPAFFALVGEADRNGAQAGRILSRALNLRDRS